MRVWKVLDLYCTDEELEKQLNQLETEGKHLKEIIGVGKSHYKIIYTVEDLTEEATAWKCEYRRVSETPMTENVKVVERL